MPRHPPCALNNLTTHTAHNTTPHAQPAATRQPQPDNRPSQTSPRHLAQQPAINNQDHRPGTLTHTKAPGHRSGTSPTSQPTRPHNQTPKQAPDPGLLGDRRTTAPAKATGHTRSAATNKTLASTMQFTSNKQPTSPTRHQTPITIPCWHPRTGAPGKARAGMTETGPAPGNKHQRPFPQDPTVCPNHPAPPARFPLPPHTQ